ncbi:MAG: DUF211 domain-containing protein [Agriterribacter sp.]
MGIRQILLEVDKAGESPEIVGIAAAIESVDCVEGLSIVVNEIDMETVGMEITVEGEDLKYDGIVAAIENTGVVRFNSILNSSSETPNGNMN